MFQFIQLGLMLISVVACWFWVIQVDVTGQRSEIKSCIF